MFIYVFKGPAMTLKILYILVPLVICQMIL